MWIMRPPSTCVPGTPAASSLRSALRPGVLAEHPKMVDAVDAGV